MCAPANEGMKLPFPLTRFARPWVDDLRGNKGRLLYRSASLLTTSLTKPNIVDESFAIDLFKIYVEIGLFHVSKRGKYNIESHNKNSAESLFEHKPLPLSCLAHFLQRSLE